MRSGTWSREPGPTYHDNTTDNILKAYGNDPSKIEVLDDKGKPQKFDPTNEQQQKDLASGKFKWRPSGTSGPGRTEANTPTDPKVINPNYQDPSSGGGKGGDNKVSGVLTIHVDKQGNVSAPASVPLSPNDRGANSGSGTAQKNNPPPGDSHLRRGGW